MMTHKAFSSKGGKANTPAQNAARAKNGKLGGRPKKQKRREPYRVGTVGRWK